MSAPLEPYDAALALHVLGTIDDVAHSLGAELRAPHGSSAMIGHGAGVLLRRAYEYYDALSGCSPDTVQDAAQELKRLLERGVGQAG